MQRKQHYYTTEGTFSEYVSSCNPLQTRDHDNLYWLVRNHNIRRWLDNIWNVSTTQLGTYIHTVQRTLVSSMTDCTHNYSAAMPYTNGVYFPAK